MFIFIGLYLKTVTIHRDSFIIKHMIAMRSNILLLKTLSRVPGNNFGSRRTCLSIKWVPYPPMKPLSSKLYLIKIVQPKSPKSVPQSVEKGLKGRPYSLTAWLTVLSGMEWGISKHNAQITTVHVLHPINYCSNSADEFYFYKPPFSWALDRLIAVVWSTQTHDKINFLQSTKKVWLVYKKFDQNVICYHFGWCTVCICWEFAHYRSVYARYSCSVKVKVFYVE